jgi:hypothetical protein
MSVSRINSNAEASRTVSPWRTAIRNSTIALLLIGIGGLEYLRKYHGFNRGTAWWVWFVVAAGVLALCFGNALIGQIIGPRRSDLIFKIVLAIALVVGVYWLCHSLDAQLK